MKVVNNRRDRRAGLRVENQGNQPTPININPADLEDVICSACGNPTFQLASMFKRLPASLAPSGKATLVPLQIWECTACRHVNDEFLPKMPEAADE